MRSYPLTMTISITYNLDELIIRYNNHPGILAIKNKCTELNSTFTFKNVDKEQISTAIKRLDSKEVSKSNDAYHSELSRSLVALSEVYLLKISMNVFFPDELKCAEVVPVYKKMIKRIRITTRPVSILSNISKLYEKCMHQQINKYFESLLSKFQ